MKVIPAVLAIALGLSNVFADGLTTAPATTSSSGGYTSGLICEIYTLPRRPKQFRDALPGLAPKNVHVALTPTISSGEDLAGNTGNVQAVYEGEIHVPKTGEFTFTANADDAMEAQIDSQVVISDAWVNGSKEQSVKTVTLTEGWHPLKIRYFQGDGGFNMRIRWRASDTTDFVALKSEDLRVSEARVAEANAKMSPTATEDAAHPHRAVFRTQGFFELPEVEGDLLVAMLEGPTRYSEACRKDFAETIKQTNYEKLPSWHQVKVLAGYLRGWPNGQTSLGPVTVRAEYKIADAVATEYDGWRGAKRAGFKHIVSVEGKDYTVFTPAADSPERENVAKGIAGLPKSLRVMLNRVRVEPYGTANEFNGGGDEIWVRRKESTPADMIDNVFAHEIGHILMNKTDCYLAWEQAIAKDILSLSQYARTNPSEDFAEFTRIYLSTHGEPAQLASLHALFPARIIIMEDSLKKVNFAWISPPATQP